jgi:hypothetical protein
LHTSLVVIAFRQLITVKAPLLRHLLFQQRIIGKDTIPVVFVAFATGSWRKS